MSIGALLASPSPQVPVPVLLMLLPLLLLKLKLLILLIDTGTAAIVQTPEKTAGHGSELYDEPSTHKKTNIASSTCHLTSGPNSSTTNVQSLKSSLLIPYSSSSSTQSAPSQAQYSAPYSSTTSSSSSAPTYPTYTPTTAPTPTAGSTSDMLWVDKYKPASSQDIIGGGDTVKKLL